MWQTKRTVYKSVNKLKTGGKLWKSCGKKSPELTGNI